LEGEATLIYSAGMMRNWMHRVGQTITADRGNPISVQYTHTF
jgi:hypothetical protein